LDLKLSINADYQQASKAFKELASESEATREKIEKFSSSFESKNIDKFIDKQKLLEASLTGTRGEVAAMTSVQKNYEREIEKLIRSGLDPESDAIQRLRTEQEQLKNKIENANEAQKAQEQVMKNAEKAALGMIAAIGASVAAMGAVVQKSAEAGDAYAKTARVIGMTAETFQELDYAAKMSGIDNLKGSLEKLNKSVADVKSGTGSLTTYLKENDKQLLNQLRNVTSNEEAFNLLIEAIGKAPDEFTRAELAQSAFGKSGQELILLANEGADGIANLREEARKYGIISEEATKNSEAYLDAQSRLKSALQGVGNELTEKMLPGLTDSINGIADFIANTDDWEGKLNIAKVALAGTTAALVTFVAVSKGAQTIHQMAIAIKALQTAIMGPAGAAALAIGALAAGITALVAWQDKQVNQGKELANNITNQKNEALNLLSTYQQLNPAKEIDKVTTDKLISIYPNLTEEMVKNAKSVDDLKKKVKELSEEETKATAQKYVDKMVKMYDEYTKAVETANTAILANRGQIQHVMLARNTITAFEGIKKQANDILGSIGLEVDISNNFNFIESAASKTQRALAEAEELSKKAAEETRKNAEEEMKKLSQRLGEISLSPEQQLNEQINQIKTFLNQRAELERASGEERIKSYQANSAALLASDKIHENERIAISKATEEAIVEVRKQMADDLKKQNETQAKEEEQLRKENEQKKKEEAEKEKNFIRDKLLFIGESEAQTLLERQNAFTTFLSERLNAQVLAQEEEKLSDEERLAYLEEQRDLLLEKFTENKEAQLAIQKAYDDLLIAEEKRTQAVEQKLLEEKLGAFSTFFNGWASLLEMAGEKNRGFAIVARALASAEAAINSYLAFTKALASAAPPFNYIAAAGVLAAGLAQQIKINSTAIPSAETGGRFIVPNSIGSDNSLMKVNSGEEVEVTPRGMTGYNNSQNIIVQIEKQVLFDVINDGIRSGDVLIAAVNY
jgi:hypothetical protein